MLPLPRLNADEPSPRLRLVVLDPGHFHASLVQKFMYPEIDPVVQVYAPAGPELDDYLHRIQIFNTRADQPTHWEEQVFRGPNFLEKMAAEKSGDIVVIAGNNRRKTRYILAAIESGKNVLGDKPLAIAPEDLPLLERAFREAAQRHRLLYDIMTERFEIATQLQRALMQQSELFGQLAPSTPQKPAVTMESVHMFSKVVGGVQLTRPEWFFDVRQQGEAIVDVGTHLVDLVQWELFPAQKLQPRDVNVVTARHWPTSLTREQFQQVTGLANFPDFLSGAMRDGVLRVMANGEFTYQLRDAWAKVTVRWEFAPPPGGGDTHYAKIRGTRANLVIQQRAEEKFVPTLSIEKVAATTDAEFARNVAHAVTALQTEFPGVGAQQSGEPGRWIVTIPERYREGHEAHFAQVTKNFI